MREKTKYNCIAGDIESMNYTKQIFMCTQVSGTLDLGFQNIWAGSQHRGVETAWDPPAFGGRHKAGTCSSEPETLFLSLIEFLTIPKTRVVVERQVAAISWGKEPVTGLPLAQSFLKRNRTNRLLAACGRPRGTASRFLLFCNWPSSLTSSC